MKNESVAYVTLFDDISHCDYSSVSD